MANDQQFQSDILQQMVNMQMSQDEVFRSINSNLQQLAKNMSLAEYENNRLSVRDRRNRYRDEDEDRDDDKWKVNRDRGTRSRRSRGLKGAIEDFEHGLVDQLERALVGDPISEMVKASLANFADSLGVGMDELGEGLGRAAGNSLANWVKSTKWGEKLFGNISSAKNNIANSLNNLFNKAASDLNTSAVTDASDTIMSTAVDASQMTAETGQAIAQSTDLATTGLDAVSTVAQGAGTAVESMGAAAGAAGPQILLAVAAITVALIALDKYMDGLTESLKAADEASKAFEDAVNKAKNRTNELLTFKLSSKVDRLEADFKSMVTASYDVMKEASQQMLDAWDSSLRTITATQGYSKAGMQDLLSNYAERLRDEGLSSVVSTADITTNLAKVLESGLSGQVAEEFAYLATVLDAAIPTEEFFDYASTYASVAANALASGRSQQEAIEYANAELEQFASNLLYSSRELAGGFSTGLKNASSLFESANKIAVASRKGQASEISGVLTAVSAAVGAVAPDLASSLVDNVVNAALGGNNNSAIPALRSLSGVGASNTAFLEALATDAKSVFATLFENLANLQNMSADNYMEVAEGLSEIFGISMDAFARVDFSYLSDVIDAMNIDGDSLGKNLSLLVSGQTTYTAEQARIAEVNKIMIDEGLSYVLDNEVARSIQEHMWDEQLAQDIKETEFAVNLQGTALKFLQTLVNVVEKIHDFLNPLAAKTKVANLLETAFESSYKSDEIEELLKATVVGQGNKTSLYNLTHSGTDLNLTQSYLERLGASSPDTISGRFSDYYHKVSHTSGLLNRLINGSYSAEYRENLAQWYTGKQQQASAGVEKDRVASSYTWATVGKSALASSGLSRSATASPYAALTESTNTAQQTMTNAIQQRLQDLFGSMQSFVDERKSYDEWAATAKNYGIQDLEQSLADYGITLTDVENQYRDMQTAAGLLIKQQRDEQEAKYLEDSITWYETTYPSDFTTLQDVLADMHDELMDQLVKSHRQLSRFYDEWIDYYVNHTAYSQETLDAYNVAAIRSAERSEVGDSVLALAEALTSNTVDLKDPAVQTNVLLAKILIVAEAIMQQTNDTTTVSLPTALASLGLGYTTETTQII